MEKETPIFAIPLAILAAGIIIAAAIYFKSNAPSSPAAPANPEKSVDLSLIPDLGADDHIRGNPAAPIKIIEYSDLECPFCKQFHQVLTQLVKNDPDRVVWVYRHFPLTDLHSKAETEAVATECAAQLGGEDKFWELTDQIFAVTPANNGLDLARLPELAGAIGLDTKLFAECLAANRPLARVRAQTEEARSAGAGGTPFSVLIRADGKRFALPGYLPLEAMRRAIDEFSTSY